MAGMSPQSCHGSQVKSGRHRWLVTISYSANAFMNSFLAMNFSSIQPLTQDIFECSSSEVALLYSGVLMTAIPSMLIASKALTKWPYMTEMVNVVLCSSAAWVRLIAFNQRNYWLCFVSVALVGFSGGVMMISPPFISHMWFVGKERWLATCTMGQMNFIASALSMMLVPALVRDYDSGKKVAEMLACCAVVNVFIFATLYRRPPNCEGSTLSHPNDEVPCSPTHAETEPMLAPPRFGTILRMPQFWIRCLSFGILGGNAMGMPGIQDAILHKSFGMSDVETSWLNLAFFSSGVVVGLASGVFVTSQQASARLLKILLACASVSVTVLALLTEGYIDIQNTSTRYVALCVCNAIAGAACQGFVGLGFECMAELPISTSYTASAMESLMMLAGAGAVQLGTSVGFGVLAGSAWIAALLFCLGHRPLIAASPLIDQDVSS